MVHVSTRVLPDPSVGGAVLGDDTAIDIRGLLVWTQQRRASAKITGAVQLFKGMADRSGFDVAGAVLGRFDVAGGWRIVEGMKGGCYCDLSNAECVVARHPPWTKAT